MAYPLINAIQFCTKIIKGNSILLKLSLAFLLASLFIIIISSLPFNSYGNLDDEILNKLNKNIDKKETILKDRFEKLRERMETAISEDDENSSRAELNSLSNAEVNQTELKAQAAPVTEASRKLNEMQTPQFNKTVTNEGNLEQIKPNKTDLTTIINGTSESSEKWQTYSNVLYGFKIDHPNYWRVTERDSHNIELKNSLDPTMFFSFSIFVTDDILPSDNIDKLARNYVERQEGMLNNLPESLQNIVGSTNVVSLNKTAIGKNGLKANELLIDEGGEEKTRSLNLIAINNGILYHFTYQNSIDEFGSKLPFVKKIIESFELIG